MKIYLFRKNTLIKLFFSIENVKPICLPVGESAKIELIGKMATISGWGMTEHGI